MAEAIDVPESNWYQPRLAMRAVRNLLEDGEDTKQVFTIIRAMSGPSRFSTFKRFIKTPVGRRVMATRASLAAVLNDRDGLRNMPEGSLGRAYLAFVESENLSADGLTQANEEGGYRHGLSPEQRLVSNRTRDMHDLWHVTTGYGRDGLGELALLAFSFAQLGNLGVLMIVYFGGRAYLNGFPEARIWAALWEGYRNGRHATWWAAEDWEGLLSAPLADVREQLRVRKPVIYREVLAYLEAHSEPPAGAVTA